CRVCGATRWPTIVPEPWRSTMDERDSPFERLESSEGIERQALLATWERYTKGSANLVEQHLDRRLSSLVDVPDVLQSAFAPFYRRSVQGQFRLDRSTPMWKLPATITVRKVYAKLTSASGRRHITTGQGVTPCKSLAVVIGGVCVA